MKEVALLLVAIALGGCASTFTVGASTPRSVTVHGSAWTSESAQQAFNVGQAACQKHGRHARLRDAQGTRPNAVWLFDCVD